VSVLTDSAAEAAVITSHLKGSVIRPMYSSPPLYGARLVHAILSNPELKSMWLKECSGMAERIHAMRTLLKDTLDKLEGVASDDSRWKHVTKQVGMFCYSGLNPEQVAKLRTEHHIYCTADGRMSMAGVNTSNVEYLAHSIHAVM
jgi:aspartate aminotransferase, mitochondrial